MKILMAVASLITWLTIGLTVVFLRRFLWTRFHARKGEPNHRGHHEYDSTPDMIVALFWPGIVLHYTCLGVALMAEILAKSTDEEKT